MLLQIEKLVQAGKDPKSTVLKSMRDTGKKAVGCFPIYVPEEIIHAAGLLPVGLWGGQTDFKEVDRYLQSFCCSIMRANVELGIKGAYDMLEAVVITAYCDTLRAVQANWPVAVPGMKVLSMVYPQNRVEGPAVEYMLEKFRKLQKELEAISGVEVTEERLEESYALYERWRAAMREFARLAATHPKTVNVKIRHYVMKASYYMDKQEYTPLLEEINAWLRTTSEEQGGIGVVITGLVAEPENFLDLFVENGIYFTADDLAQESRQFRTLSRLQGSVLEKIAYRAIDLKGCTFFYEEQKSKGQRLVEMAQDAGAAGVVVCMYKFCDPEEFDFPVLKKEVEEAGIPLLYVEIEQQMDSVEQLRTRIQSFAEML